DIYNSKILIVEDNYLGRVVLKEIFKKQGFIHIEEAEDGEEGLRKVNSFRPDLVILDVVMLGMDGVECCKRIRSNPDQKIANVPILFQTALDGTANKTRFFEAGGTDYLTKPVDSNEITARAVVHLERELVVRRLMDFKERVASELDTARATQQVLIPNKKDIEKMEKDYGLQICSHYQPCSEVGGDFWGFKSLSSDELAVYTVDFSGHGVNAALNAFRLHALMQATMDTAHIPGAYLTHLNAILSPLLPTGQFATMFYGIINNKKNTFAYASAASPPPVIFKDQGADFQLLDIGGTLLGAINGTTYNTTEVEFNVNDCLLLYSDALIETADEQDVMPSIEEWVEYIQSSLKAESKGGIKTFEELLAEFSKHYSPRLGDDLTLNTYFRV
ncbi:MAG: fused response regulator/phosphatase, partial [Rickettsiales bacterium]